MNNFKRAVAKNFIGQSSFPLVVFIVLPPNNNKWSAAIRIRDLLAAQRHVRLHSMDTEDFRQKPQFSQNFQNPREFKMLKK